MIKIAIAPQFKEAKTYVLQYLFKEVLGLEIAIKIEDTAHTRIELSNKLLIVEDHFFNKIAPAAFPDKSQLPQKVERFSSSELTIDSLPVLYGVPEIELGSDIITCKIDLLASSFFMLSRWEENIGPKDKHGRFPFHASIAAQYDFFQRPIVNEYIDLLMALINLLEPSLQRKPRSFKIIPTHDIDHIYKWGTISNIRKKLAHNFITKGSFKLGFQNLVNLFQVKINKATDPYFQFEYLMGLSEKYGLQSHFYFLTGNRHKVDADFKINDPRLSPIFESIQKRGHRIGYHPSYLTTEDQDLWEKEKLLLDKTSGITTLVGRQHYLRFDVPQTWAIWDNNNMKMDSTLGYSENIGFRCGICYPYPVFDIEQGKQLDLIESPLLFMEVAAIEHMQLTPKQANEQVFNLMQTVKKHQGNFVFLWHNNTLFNPEDEKFRFIYENIISDFTLHGK